MDQIQAKQIEELKITQNSFDEKNSAITKELSIAEDEKQKIFDINKTLKEQNNNIHIILCWIYLKIILFIYSIKFIMEKKFSYDEPKNSLNNRINAHLSFSNFNLHEWVKTNQNILSQVYCIFGK